MNLRHRGVWGIALVMVVGGVSACAGPAAQSPEPVTTGSGSTPAAPSVTSTGESDEGGPTPSREHAGEWPAFGSKIGRVEFPSELADDKAWSFSHVLDQHPVWLTASKKITYLSADSDGHYSFSFLDPTTGERAQHALNEKIPTDELTRLQGGQGTGGAAAVVLADGVQVFYTTEQPGRGLGGSSWMLFSIKVTPDGWQEPQDVGVMQTDKDISVEQMGGSVLVGHFRTSEPNPASKMFYGPEGAVLKELSIPAGVDDISRTCDGGLVMSFDLASNKKPQYVSRSGAAGEQVPGGHVSGEKCIGYGYAMIQPEHATSTTYTLLKSGRAVYTADGAEGFQLDKNQGGIDMHALRDGGIISEVGRNWVARDPKGQLLWSTPKREKEYEYIQENSAGDLIFYNRTDDLLVKVSRESGEITETAGIPSEPLGWAGQGSRESDNTMVALATHQDFVVLYDSDASNRDDLHKGASTFISIK